ncbi:MAG: hypothetical protein O3B01_29980 [Planctomycetota bacterium]|nr:hypothetical protein [Planctomycetota bacterium]MDA1142813.1 hypothetical protein [Planctomycetota bacterium]
MESDTDKTGPASPLLIRVGKLFEKELAQENDYLRAENKILRSKLGNRIQLTENDRQILVRFGMPIRDRLRDVVSIVKPETLLAWNRKMKREKWTFQKLQNQAGRPAKGADVENTVVRLAEETTWGYQRIAGEMKKLGHDVSGSYVRDVLKKHGLPPSPQTKGLSWKQFIHRVLPTAKHSQGDGFGRRARP